MTSLQPLATAVAASWATSRVMEGVPSALVKLVPGLAYASVAVVNPSQQRWSMVHSSNLAAGPQLEMMLLDPQQSAAGLALRSGKLVQSSLLNGARQFSQRLGDAAALLAAAPAATLMLCLPLKPDAAKDGGALQGALLLGIEQEGQLSKRQLAALLVLAQLLPGALWRASHATGILETVDFMTGARPYECPCCMSDEDGESDDDGDEGPNSPCSDDEDPDSSGHPPPTQPLLVPGAGGGAATCGGARPGSNCCPACTGCTAVCSAPPAAAEPATAVQPCSCTAAAAAAVAGTDVPACTSRAGSLQCLPGCKAKCCTSAAAASSSDLSEAGSLELDEHTGAKTPRARQLPTFQITSDKRQRLWMTFEDPALEREFLKWHSSQHVKIDRLFTLLLLAALCIVGFCHPFKLVDRNPWGLLLGWVLLLPLVAVLDRKAYTVRRERVVVVMRLLLVAFINLVSIPSYQAFVEDEKLTRRATFWMLTGAESLLITALGLQVRFHLQLPLQFACMAIAAWHVPPMCAVCYPGITAMLCQARSMRLLVGAGVILPSAVLRFVEGKSRDAFIHELRAAAA